MNVKELSLDQHMVLVWMDRGKGDVVSGHAVEV